MLLGAWLSGCASCGGGKVNPQDAEVQVARFFEALDQPQPDPEKLCPMLAGPPSPQQCHDILAEMRSHHLGLLEVVGSAVDGRDPHAVIVRARLTMNGAPKQDPALIRAERTDGTWKLRF